MTRRELLAAAAASLAPPASVLVDTHIHLFADDQKSFPYHPQGTYKPPAAPLESYIPFVREAGIAHTVIIHPEPYQDDHRYLEYCFAHEPSPGFFKGTCLFDPIDPKTPARIAALVGRHPARIVALRVHSMDKQLTTSGPIRNRDLGHPAMKTTWRAAADRGIAIQMHFIPFFAPQIGTLAAQFPNVPVILDHLARAGQGTPAEYDEVLRLAKYPRVYMKYSGVRYSSKQDYPFADAKPLVRRAYDAFGADRVLWGGLGHNKDEFRQAVALFDQMFDYASEADRVKIRGLNALKLFAWKS
jgi:predicted TIM-barrel fold metal-dependent hydrolase